MGGLLHLVQRGDYWAVCGPAQSPPRCTKYNNPPIDGKRTNLILFDVKVNVNEGYTPKERRRDASFITFKKELKSFLFGLSFSL